MAGLKTRDIRDILQRKGDHGVLYVLEAQNEHILGIQNDLREMGIMLDKIIDAVSGVVAVGERMKSTLESAEGDLGPNTHALDRGDN